MHSEQGFQESLLLYLELLGLRRRLHNSQVATEHLTGVKDVTGVKCCIWMFQLFLVGISFCELYSQSLLVQNNHTKNVFNIKKEHYFFYAKDPSKMFRLRVLLMFIN